MPGVYHIRIHSGKIWKQLMRDTEVGETLAKSLKKRRHRDRFTRLIETSHQLPHIGPHIVSGTVTSSRGDYCSPYIKGLTLADMDSLLHLSLRNRFHLTVSITELSLALAKFHKTHSYMMGDWAMHNIVYDSEKHNLKNVDLEGFYTYGPWGLPLSWKGDEANTPRIRQQLRKVQRQVVQSMKAHFRSSGSLITTITCLSRYPMWIPFSLTSSRHPHTSYTIQSTDHSLGDLDTYWVYLYWYNNLPVMRVSQARHVPTSYITLFQFYSKETTTPPHAYLRQLNNPKRSILVDITKSNSQLDVPLWFVDPRIHST